MDLRAYLIVFVGGGTMPRSRHGFNTAFARLLGTASRYATFFENISASIVMGCLVAYFAFKSGIPQHWQLFSPPAFLGATRHFRRFRSMSRCSTSAANWDGFYVLLLIALSIGGLFAGLALVRNFA